MQYIIHQGAIDYVRREARRNVEQAGMDLALGINNAVQIPGPPRSAPGEPPRIDKHRLHGSYETAMHPSEPTCYVGTEVPYAPWLEQGTNAGLEARPHIVPTLMAMQGQLAYRMGTTNY